MKCVERSQGYRSRKKAAFKQLSGFPSEENKTQYKHLRNQTREIVARSMRMEANQELNDLYQNSNSVLYFLRRIKKEGCRRKKVLKRKRRTMDY